MLLLQRGAGGHIIVKICDQGRGGGGGGGGGGVWKDEICGDVINGQPVT